MIPQPAFIDTHLHIWNPEHLHYGWLETAPAVLNQVHEPDQLLAEAQESGLAQAVLVQAANHVDETQYLLEQAERHHWIAGVVGWVDLMNPSLAAAQLQDLTKNPLFKGVRHLIHTEENEAWLIQKPVLESLALLATYGLTYDVVGTQPAHLTAALTVAQRFPALKLVIDHLNQPPIQFAEAFNWKSRMQSLASCPNVVGKISGLGTALGKEANWTWHEIQPWLEFALSTFGADRLLLGSDWPVCLLAGSYQHAIDQYRAGILSLVPPQEAQLIFSINAERTYGL